MHSAQPFRNGFKQEVIAIIIRDVVQGLEYLHNLGYVHRYCTPYSTVIELHCVYMCVLHAVDTCISLLGTLTSIAGSLCPIISLVDTLGLATSSLYTCTCICNCRELGQAPT